MKIQTISPWNQSKLPNLRPIGLLLAALSLMNPAPAALASGGVQFDGANDHITFGTASGLGSATFTLETWFIRTGTGSAADTGTGGVSAIPLIAKGRGEADGNNRDMNYFLGIRTSDGVLVADFEEGAGGSSPGLNHPVIGVTPVSNNVWHHAAVTYDGSKWQLFLDGVLDAELTVGQPPRADSIQHASLATAMNSSGTASGAFAGILDEVRIWNVARTETQIATDRFLQISSASGLIGRWALDETNGNTAHDSSGSGIDGTLVNGPSWVTGFNFVTPPAVAITNPTDYQSFVSPTDVLIEATASDTDGAVTSVEFFEGTTSLGTDTSAPYSFNWTSVATGQYVLTAVATDDSSLSTTSAPVHITINNPIVSLTSPTQDQVFAEFEDIPLAATASDANGAIVLVEFFQGATKLGEDASAPYTLTWSGAAPGSYVLTAVATDVNTVTTTSSPVTITVEANVPPSVALTAPANSDSFTLRANIPMSATASDADGSVVRVEFYANNVKLGEDTTSPYDFVWTTAGFGPHVLQAVAVDNGGLSSTSAPVSITVDNVLRLVTSGDVWKYLDNGSDQGTAWQLLSFNDSAWASGPSQLGYGDGDEATVVGYGPNANNKYITTYFRRTVNVTDAANFSSLTLNVLRDDGVVVYLNGTEVFRNAMPTGTIGASTLASATAGGTDESAYYQTAVNPALLVEGDNILAVEIHQAAANSSDISFDMELTGERPPITIDLVSPAHGATDVNYPAELSVIPTDPNGGTLEVTFYGRVAGPPPGPDFTIVALPDTQYYVSSLNGGTPAMFTAQTDWIVANKTARNIQFVTHLGDCVENGDNGGNNSEWLNAIDAMYRLEDPLTTFLTHGIPYGIAVGNHDQTPIEDPNGTTTFYNQYFGVPHFSGRDYYGGNYGTNNDNHYETFQASGMDFIVIHLEFDTTPDAPILDWANNLLQSPAYSNHRAIVVTHWMIEPGSQSAFSTQGQAIYNALKANPNLFLLLGGHRPGEGRRVDTYAGRDVNTLLADYQSRTGGGNGWMRIMEFSPSNNVIRVMTYSPYLDQWETDADSQFTLPYDMTLPGPAFNLVQTNPAVPSGTTTTASWSGLSPNTEYEWYATASDGLDVVSSSLWRFQTADSASPVATLTSPANYSVFAQPADILITADATDADSAVTKVEFFADAIKLGEDLTAPYEWNWSSVPAGIYTLTAVAHDDTARTGTSEPIVVTVSDPGVPNVPPTVAITSPANASDFLTPTDILIEADASDNDGLIARVEFYAGANKLSEDTTAPYSFYWSQVPVGAYTLTAVAVDNVGAQTVSAPVSVSVSLAPEIAAITRGPYLQIGTPSSMIVRWRTDVPTGSRLRYGTDPANLNQSYSDLTTTTEHIVPLTGLAPDTRYYYELGTATEWFTPDAFDYFVTSPTTGTVRPIRIWAIGDSGTKNADAANVRDAYRLLNGTADTDLWLMLGDNAYDNGTDAEYQAAVFNMYPTILQNTVLWPAIGNHDTAGSANPSPSLPYFNMFSLPDNGQAGGLPSGTEKYYSFDYANIHFICLDSMTSSRLAGGPMLTWLENDLATTTQPWIIAYWHHPPYTKGSHNSDTETELVEMRQNALPLLEAAGVDLVLGGHSHSFERSYLIDGHYGTSATFSQSMKKDGGDGREDGNGAYTKDAAVIPHQGAVYVVAGSSGKISGGSLNHPAMFYSANLLGSLVIDVDGSRLNAYFLGTNGLAEDYFTIIKTNAGPVIPLAPDNLTALTVSSTEIFLSWNDNSSDETGFKIERSLNGVDFVEIATVGANVSSGTDGGLTPNTDYYYRVRAYNAAGDSAYSNTANATTDPLAPPPPPTGLTATALDSRVNLSWNASSGAISYTVKRSTTSGTGHTSIASGLTALTYSDDTAVNGTGYFYVVVAVNGAGEGLPSSEVSATPQPPPTAPDGFAATPASFDQIDLTWADQSDNETGFRLERSDDGSPFTQIAELGSNVTAYADQSLVPSSLYTYRLTAYNGSGTSDFAEAAATTLAPPAPSGLNASPGNASVTLTWNSVAGASGYNLKRATSPTGPFAPLTPTQAATTFLDDTVQNGLTYYYVVSTVISGVEGPDSAAVSATPVAPPAAPSALFASADSPSQITLNWFDNASNETGYRVERSVDNIVFTVAATLAMNEVSYTNGGLQPITTYYYRVIAFNAGGDSAPAEATATTLPPPPPAPTGLSATVGNRIVHLTWNESEGATSYEVFRSTISNGPYDRLIYGLGNTAFDDVTVANGVTYYYVVQAANSGGSGEASEEITVVPGGPPADPSDLSIGFALQDEIDLSWTDNSDDEDGFQVERSTDGVNYQTVGTTLANVVSYTDSGLTDNTTYYYRVRAFNSAYGLSGFSETSGKTLATPPAAPDSLNATALSASEIQIVWTDLATNEDDYELERSLDGMPWSSLIVLPANTTGYVDSGLNADTTYYYRVRAHNSGDYSAYSPTDSATTLPNPPTAPDSLTVTAQSTNQIQVNWTDLATNEDGYQLERSLDGVAWSAPISFPADSTSYLDSGLSTDTTYFYRVRAFNTGGNSAYSPTGSTTTWPPIPPVPTGLTATAGNAQVLLSWDASPGATSYDIWTSTSSEGTYIPLESLVTGTSYLDLNVINGVTYFYKVSANNITGSSDLSLEVNATPTAPPAVPTAPSGLIAIAASTQQIDLTWTDNANDELAYEVERSLDGTTWLEIAVLSPDTESYSDQGLTSGLFYYYRVRASNTGGDSDYSNVARTAPYIEDVAQNDLPVANLAISGSYLDTQVSDSSVEAITERESGGKPNSRYSYLEHKWSFNITGGSEVTFYVQAFRSANPEGDDFVFSYSTDDIAYSPMTGITINNATQTSYQSFTLPASLSGPLYIRVTDTDQNPGNNQLDTLYIDHMFVRSIPSAAALPPATPTGLTATAGDMTVTLNWNPVAEATSYTIKRALTSGGAYEVIALGVTASTYDDAGLINNTAYYYVVSAVNAAGESPNSNEATATPQVGPVPSTPTGLVATGGNAEVSLSWDAVPEAASYNVYRSLTSGGPYTTPVATGITDTSYMDSGLINDTPYYYVVTAVNGSQESLPSAEVSATPTIPLQPLPPTNLQVTIPAKGKRKLALDWTQSASAGVTENNIYRSTTSGAAYQLIATIPAGTSYQDSGLNTGTTYYYRVTALANGVESDPSNESFNTAN